MVSFHEALSGSPRAKVDAEFGASSKKRKWEEEPFVKEFFNDQTNSQERKSAFGIELNLDTPFTPDNWRQYLSIQSRQIDMCNTRVNGTTMEDTMRSSSTAPFADHMSLDLELNLTSESLRKKEDDTSYDHISHDEKQSPGSLGSLGQLHEDDLMESSKSNKKDSDGLVHSSNSPSWLSSSDGSDHKEMVATVCMRCHMLVMLCKSSPACPNCKFMHPPDQNPSKFLKRGCSLFC